MAWASRVQYRYNFGSRNQTPRSSQCSWLPRLQVGSGIVQTLRVSAQQNQISPLCRVIPWTSGAGTSISAVTAPLSWIEPVNLAHLRVGAPQLTVGHEDAVGPQAGRGNRAPDLHRGRIDQVELPRGRHRNPHGPVVQPLEPVRAGHVRPPRLSEPDDALARRVVVVDRGAVQAQLEDPGVIGRGDPDVAPCPR